MRNIKDFILLARHWAAIPPETCTCETHKQYICDREKAWQAYVVARDKHIEQNQILAREYLIRRVNATLAKEKELLQ